MHVFAVDQKARAYFQVTDPNSIMGHPAETLDQWKTEEGPEFLKQHTGARFSFFDNKQSASFHVHRLNEAAKDRRMEGLNIFEQFFVNAMDLLDNLEDKPVRVLVSGLYCLFCMLLVWIGFHIALSVLSWIAGLFTGMGGWLWGALPMIALLIGAAAVGWYGRARADLSEAVARALKL